MICSKTVIFLLFILVPAYTGCCSESRSRLLKINKLVEHANRLVREGNYYNASYFYNEVIKNIDLHRSENNNTCRYRDSVITAALNHYSNFSSLKELNMYPAANSKLFVFDKTDFELRHPNTDSYDPLPDKELNMVKKWINNYTDQNRSTFQAYLNRSAAYVAELKKIFRHFGLPEDLAYVPMAESGYSPFAHSYAKASGLWQFIPATGRAFGLNYNWWEDDRKNIIKSTIAAAKYYIELYEEFGDWNLVLSAYNSGCGRVRRAVRTHNTTNFWQLSSLPRETKEYVPRIRALVKVAKEYEKYGFEKNKELFLPDTVMLDSCVSIHKIAKAANTSYENIKRLNPHLRQWVLPPYATDYPVIIPAASKIDFRKKFSQFKQSDIYPVIEHKVKKGEDIKKIADLYKVDTAAVNDLNNDLKEDLKAGDIINVLPPPLDQKWFTNFNNRYLTYYDDEKYFLDGREKAHYIVRRGDSVWAISRKFKIDHKKLRAWNKISGNNLIKPGQRLVIYL
ncbi:MAG: transglycosylase SLT domain-containing protein [Candidatus Delongbacteria bacterium]